MTAGATVVGREGPAWHDVGPGRRLQLWPQRAAFDPALRMLFVADAHLGKAVSFRRWGVPVPESTTHATLARLDELLQATAATGIVFLGDLLHSRRAHAPSLLTAVRAWRERHAALRLLLVRGNHDEHAGDPPADWRIETVTGPWRLGPWTLVHAPEDAPEDAPGGAGDAAPDASPAYVLAGHLHPGASLHGRGGDRLRLPTFHFGPRVGVLPAFGDFTGLHAMPAAPHTRRYAIADRWVCPLETC